GVQMDPEELPAEDLDRAEHGTEEEKSGDHAPEKKVILPGFLIVASPPQIGDEGGKAGQNEGGGQEGPQRRPASKGFLLDSSGIDDLLEGLIPGPPAVDTSGGLAQDLAAASAALRRFRGCRSEDLFLQIEELNS